MEVNAKNLLASGYVKYADNLHDSNGIYQKMFPSYSGGKRFFVTFTEWSMSAPNPGTLVYEAMMQVNTPDRQTINIQFLRPDSIEVVEEWALKLWEASGAVYFDD